MVWIVALILPMLIVACVGLVLSNKVAFALTYGLHAFGKAVLLVWDLLAWIWFWLIFVVEWVIGAWWPSADKRGAAELSLGGAATLAPTRRCWHGDRTSALRAGNSRARSCYDIVCVPCCPANSTTSARKHG